MRPFEVAPAREEDLDYLLGLWEALDGEMIPLMPEVLRPREEEVDVEALSAYVSGLICGTGGFALVARDGEERLGGALIEERTRPDHLGLSAHLEAIRVEPAARGRGVARALVEEMKEIARRRDCSYLSLRVLEGNRAARSLYEETGFAPVRTDMLCPL